MPLIGRRAYDSGPAAQGILSARLERAEQSSVRLSSSVEFRPIDIMPGLGALSLSIERSTLNL